MPIGFDCGCLFRSSMSTYNQYAYVRGLGTARRISSKSEGLAVKPFMMFLTIAPIMAAMAESAHAAPAIANSSFESPAPAPFPTYGPISNWTESATGCGVNTVSGPFWDNGVNTSGTQVGFIQNQKFLTQSVPGFEAGKT